MASLGDSRRLSPYAISHLGWSPARQRDSCEIPLCSRAAVCTAAPRRALARGARRARRRVLHPGRVERRAPAAVVVAGQLQTVAVATVSGVRRIRALLGGDDRRYVNRRCVPREWACYDFFALCRRSPAGSGRRRHGTEAMNNDIESIQRRIARSLARVHELKADPAGWIWIRPRSSSGSAHRAAKHAGEGARRYLRDARRTGRDYCVTGRGPGTHR